MVTLRKRREPRVVRDPRGAAILQHRSIWSLRLPRHRLAVGLAIALSFTALLLVARPWIGQAWAETLVWWMHALALPGTFQLPDPKDVSVLSVSVPSIDLRLGYTGLHSTEVHALACVAVWILAGWLPDHARPAVYLLRFAVLIHAFSLVYFLAWPARFPHALSSHVAGGLRQTWALMLITPWLHLFTYYVFPFAAWKRVALTLVTLLFLFVLAPLQYASHAAVLSLTGVMAMPLLYLLFGVMLPILGLVALYGWAMSWGGGARPVSPVRA